MGHLISDKGSTILYNILGKNKNSTNELELFKQLKFEYYLSSLNLTQEIKRVERTNIKLFEQINKQN